MDEVEKRFGCDECGHTFVMECEEDMMPKFCPFCGNPVYGRDVDEQDAVSYTHLTLPTNREV